MCATTATLKGTVLLYDVPWKTYEGLIDALPEHHMRHTYQEGTLELFDNVLNHVSWAAYEKILKAFGDHRFPHTYQDGVLEIMMSPSDEHEWIKRCLGRMIEMTAIRFGIRIRSAGSATQRQKKLMQGLEADESYYVEHESMVRGKHLSASSKPPADLVVEVSLRKWDLERMKSYAKLGVREVWRYRKASIEFFVLADDGRYQNVEQSHAFPMITPQAIIQFLQRLHETDENTGIMEFVKSLKRVR